MNADIITIGDEILIGQIVDTNSAWIAQVLNKIGISVRQMVSISDNTEAIKSALDLSLQYSDFLVITGGIGPTNDDITKKTLAEYFETTLEFNQQAFDKVKEFVLSRGGDMNQNNMSQAMLPKNARIILNDVGTASGMCFEKNGKFVFSLPGVPYEMKYLMKKEILQFIQMQYSTPFIFHKTVLTSGIAESKLAEMISGWEESLPEFVKLAYLPSPGMVRLRLSATGIDKINIEDIVNSKVETLKVIVKDAFLGFDEETHVSVLMRLLENKNATIAVAESCSGGSIAHHLTLESGISKFFKGGVVAYSNEVKVSFLDVNEQDIKSFGAVSQQVVEQMADGARRRFNVDYAIATSGIAGPEGGSEEKPVGTVWIAVSGKDLTFSQKFQFGNIRENTIKRTSLTALMLLINYLRK